MNLEVNADLFEAGRKALAASQEAFSGRAFFVAARRLQQDGSWTGPHDAVAAMVEEDVLPSLGGLRAAQQAGANTVLFELSDAVAMEAITLGMRCLVRVPFASGETVERRGSRREQLTALFRRIPGLDGVMPLPLGEAQGLDTIQFFASCRLACRATHVIVDLERLGHKLGQLCLSFGADEILGSIVKQRALRLGARASSNEITREEAAMLLRASDFAACERLPEGKVQVL
jgi:hypothetical protein